MTSTQDASLGVAVESVYGTSVTPTRWCEFVSETLDFKKVPKQGSGLRVGSRVLRLGRRAIVTSDGGGDVIVEACSKGMGLLWQACLGAGTSTLVSTGTYQQVFTLGDAPASLTVQKGLPQAGGGIDAYTFFGGSVSSWEFDFLAADIAQLKMTLDAKGLATATSYAPPSYPAAPVNLFHFANGSISMGTVTPPTGIALATGGTPVADIRGGTVVVNNAQKEDRFNFGGGGQKAKPTIGLRGITGKLDIEYDSTTFRDALMADTTLTLVLNYTAGVLGVGLETLQIVLSGFKLETKLPMTNGTDLIVQNMTFTAGDDLVAAQPIWVAMRTADIAL